MTDIVQRLRDQGKDAFSQKYSLGMFKLCDEAATEIERLRAAFLLFVQRDNACQAYATGEPCRAAHKCGCALEMQNYIDEASAQSPADRGGT